MQNVSNGFAIKPGSSSRNRVHFWRCSVNVGGSQVARVVPPNAMLNLLYTLLESEARLAIAALGLDPGLGMLHADTQARDALACDLMEPIRPQVDAYLLDWLRRGLLSRKWFFEQRDGNCRLMASLAARLSETCQIWARAVAPLAEKISRVLWSTTRKPSVWFAPATRLTQQRRHRSRHDAPSPENALPKLPVMCRGCGGPVTPGHTRCRKCAIPIASKALVENAKIGRIATTNQQQKRFERSRCEDMKPKNAPGNQRTSPNG